MREREIVEDKRERGLCVIVIDGERKLESVREFSRGRKEGVWCELNQRKRGVHLSILKEEES